MHSTGEPPIRVFLSYARADDLVLEFIDSFATSLRHMALADQGRNLDIFIDRESIDWGANWQAAVRQGIEGAMVFMPIVTRQYFDRPACREELLTFSSEAKALGVSSLLLPVILLGHSYVSAESQDVAARIVSERQCRDLKDAWVAGPQSAEWRAAIVRLSGELVGAATAAERSLAESGAGTVVETSHQPLVAGDDPPGAAEVGEALEYFGEESARLVTSLVDVLEAVPGLMPDTEGLQRMAPTEVRQVMLDIAARLHPIGVEFQDKGREFESVAMKTDEIMRGYVRYLRENQLDEILERERASLDGADEALAPIAETEVILTEFLEQIRPLEVSSAPMRNALRGFRDGGRAVNSGIAIMRTWPRIIEDG